MTYTSRETMDSLKDALEQRRKLTKRIAAAKTRLTGTLDERLAKLRPMNERLRHLNDQIDELMTAS